MVIGITTTVDAEMPTATAADLTAVDAKMPAANAADLIAVDVAAEMIVVTGVDAETTVDAIVAEDAPRSSLIRP